MARILLYFLIFLSVPGIIFIPLILNESPISELILPGFLSVLYIILVYIKIQSDINKSIEIKYLDSLKQPPQKTTPKRKISAEQEDVKEEIKRANKEKIINAKKIERQIIEEERRQKLFHERKRINENIIERFELKYCKTDKKNKTDLKITSKVKEVPDIKPNTRSIKVTSLTKSVTDLHSAAHKKETGKTTIASTPKLNNLPVTYHLTNEKFVDYPAYLIKESINEYPIVRMPEKGCIVRSHSFGANKRKGYKEPEFFEFIKDYFVPYFLISDNVSFNIGLGTRPYEPDISIISKILLKNIFIDIEIDEPYSGIDRRLTHCKGTDLNRDTYFTKRGWIVIRFSEYQVHKQPMDCLFFIASVINKIDPNFNIPYHLIKNIYLIKENCWSEFQARKWEQTFYREKYLNHSFSPQFDIRDIISSGLTIQELKEEKKVKPYAVQNKPAIPSIKSYNYTIPDKIITKSYPILQVNSEADYPSVKTLIRKAVSEGKSIKLVYRNYDYEISSRVISNLKYNNEFSGYHNDHIIGFCSVRKEERTFKISRMISLELL